MGGDSTSSRALIQSAGGAYRLSAQLMKEEFDRGTASAIAVALDIYYQET
jgi:predicted nucleic acid-binding protein